MNAGIHPSAVPVGGLLDDPHIMHALDDHPDWHPEFLSNPAGLLLAVGLARAAVAEWACKMDRRKLDPLIDHHLYGQCAVQPARHEHYRLFLHAAYYILIRALLKLSFAFSEAEGSLSLSSPLSSSSSFLL